MGVKGKPILKPCPRCGKLYQYRRASGRTFDLCERCRMPDCVVCGKKVPPERGRRNTCCEECEKLKKRNIQNAFYAKKVFEDPDANRKQHKKAKERRESDPESMRRYKESQKERHHRRMQDPTYIEKRKVYQANRWLEKKEEIIEQRKEFWDSLSDLEKAERHELNLAYQRKSKRKFIEKLRENPEEWEKYREYQRMKGQEHRQRKALNELMHNTKELLNVTDKKPK